MEEKALFAALHAATEQKAKILRTKEHASEQGEDGHGRGRTAEQPRRRGAEKEKEGEGGSFLHNVSGYWRAEAMKVSAAAARHTRARPSSPDVSLPPSLPPSLDSLSRSLPLSLSEV